jgi:tetratricopeptide (TPR) repeat protein
MRAPLKVISASLLLIALPAAWANGGGAMSMSASRAQTPQQKAREAYNDGVHEVKKADKAEAAAAEAADSGKKDKAAHEALDAYARALAKFKQATDLDPTLYEAWNYVGYTNRKLGNYDDALPAYDKALSLKPGYADALEYRGEAYLGLSRIADAQQAYLDLYGGDRALAGKLLTAMKSWATAQRANPSAKGTTDLDQLDKWIQERAQIAGQTAALTREGSAASWR